MNFILFTVTVGGVLVASLETRSDCVCGVRGREPKIVGGAETLPNEYPWMVGLYKQKKLYCGAAIISSKYLITAAHCVEQAEPGEIRAFIGGHNISQYPTDTKKIKNIISHEGFSRFSFDNDIALLELKSPILFEAHISPICLPSSFTNSRLALVAGWGVLNEKSPPSSTLRSVIVPIWTKEKCVATYSARRLTDNMICAGYEEGGKDACQNDSGGPLIVEGVTGSMEIIGIVSWGRGCARKSFPGVYTNVANYLDWIRDNMSDDALCRRRDGRRTNFLEHLAKVKV